VSPPRSLRAVVATAPVWCITAVLAAIYLIAAPPSSDLAAASYRSDLFSRVGFSLWDNSWYGGHHMVAYSLLAPALGALIGPQTVAAISMTVAAALFAALIAGRFEPRATRLAGAWFAFGAAFSLLSNRVPFDLGLAIGLAALLAAQRRRHSLALALCVVCSLSSPVDGAFLALICLAWTLSASPRMRPAVMTVAALAPIGVLLVVFPEGGTQPFAQSAFYPDLAGVLALVALIPSEQRALRIGAALYALALIASYVLPTAMGSNSDRLGALAAGPIAACVLAAGARANTRRAGALLAFALALLYWQTNSSFNDFTAAASDPAVNASYYSPLIRELQRLDVGYGARPVRIEAVPSTDHWEARWLAPHVMLARGWERQLDTDRNGLFYDESGAITAQSYRAWLQREAVAYVALPDAPADYSAVSEGRLLHGGLPYLHEVWRSQHWRLWEVRDPQPLVQAPAELRSVSTDSLTLYAPRPGTYTVRVHFTPYWALAVGDGCVAHASEDWTQIQARRAGEFHVVIRFSLGRIFNHSARCS
jgi:hypothetical protein